jgi:hypothetical protein
VRKGASSYLSALGYDDDKVEERGRWSHARAPECKKQKQRIVSGTYTPEFKAVVDWGLGPGTFQVNYIFVYVTKAVRSILLLFNVF